MYVISPLEAVLLGDVIKIDTACQLENKLAEHAHGSHTRVGS